MKELIKYFILTLLFTPLSDSYFVWCRAEISDVKPVQFEFVWRLVLPENSQWPLPAQPSPVPIYLGPDYYHRWQDSDQQTFTHLLLQNLFLTEELKLTNL